MDEYEKRTVVEHEILRCLVGSQAYGTAVSTSDEDYKSIYVPFQWECNGSWKSRQSETIWKR